MTGFAAKRNAMAGWTWLYVAFCLIGMALVFPHLNAAQRTTATGVLFLVVAVSPAARRRGFLLGFGLLALAMFTTPVQSVLEKRGGAAGVVTALDWLGWILPVLALVAMIRARDRSADIEGAA